MNVLIETHLSVEGYTASRTGTFTIPNQAFEKDADWNIAIRAYEWIQEQNKEHGYRDIEILSVIWNTEHDITNLVKQVGLDLSDDLPF